MNGASNNNLLANDDGDEEQQAVTNTGKKTNTINKKVTKKSNYGGSSSRVQPISHGDKQQSADTVNIYEMLEDTYAYEGFSKFLFYVLYVFIIYQVLAGSSRRIPVGSEKSKLKNLLKVKRDEFGNDGYAKWFVSTSLKYLDDPFYFGDNFRVLRIVAFVRPSSCNNTRSHPYGANLVNKNNNYENGIHKKSLAKSYENICPSLNSMEKNNMQELVDSLKNDHGVYSYYFKRWNEVAIPVFSAELHPDNVTQTTKNILKKFEKAMVGNKGIRLNDVVIEMLDPYTHMLYHYNCWIKEAVVKRFEQITINVDMTPFDENAGFLFWFISFILIHLYYTISEWRDYQATETYTKSVEKREHKISTLVRHITLNFWNMLDFAVIVSVWGSIAWLLYEFYIIPIPPKFPLAKDLGTVTSIEETTSFNNFKLHPWLYRRNSHMKLIIGIMFGLQGMSIVREMSWHPGASILSNTLYYSLNDLLDTGIVVGTMLTILSTSSFALFGALGGSEDFESFAMSINTVARLAFGVYEYDGYMNDGNGYGYEGIGLGNNSGFKYVFFWLTFILLSTVIVNIVIAIVSDGYQLHKDKKRRRFRQKETFIRYMFKRAFFHFIFQPLTCRSRKIGQQRGLKYFPSWLKHFQFASSKHAKKLLNLCKGPKRSNVVFDEEIEDKVFQLLFVNAKVVDHNYVVETQSISYTARRNSIFNSHKPMAETNLKKEYIPRHVKKKFFASVNSHELLKHILDTIFLLEMDKGMPMDNDFVSFLWNSYKSHSDEKKNVDLKEEMNEDNYLWKTVQPIEQRLITMEKRLSDMNKNMERMMELLAEKK